MARASFGGDSDGSRASIQRTLQALFENTSSSKDWARQAEVEPFARDPTLSLLLPLLILLSTLLFLLVFFLIFIIVLKRRRGRGIALTDNDGPIDLAREEELEGEGGLAGIEERWLEQQDDATQAGYERGKCKAPQLSLGNRPRLMILYRRNSLPAAI